MRNHRLFGPFFLPFPVLALPALLSFGCAREGLHTTAPAAHNTSRPEPTPPPHAIAAPHSAAPIDANPDAPAEDDPVPIAIPIEGTELLRGRATMKVKAPIERVRQGILDFAHYPEFMPLYSNCKVLGRTPSGAREVYMEIDVLNHTVKMWALVEVPKPVIDDGVEVYETKFVKGNVKDFNGMWRLRKLDDTTTELTLQVFLHPDFPMPIRFLNFANVDGSRKGLLAMRGRIEAAQ